MITLPVVEDIENGNGCGCKPLHIFISQTTTESEKPCTKIYEGQPNDGTSSYRVGVPDNYTNMAQYVTFQKDKQRMILCEVKVFIKGICLNYVH